MYCIALKGGAVPVGAGEPAKGPLRLMQVQHNHQCLLMVQGDAYRSSDVAISVGVVGDTQECRFWATYTARVTKLLSRYTHGA